MNQIVFLLYSGAIQLWAGRDLKLTTLSAIISPYLAKFTKQFRLIHQGSYILVQRLTVQRCQNTRITLLGL